MPITPRTTTEARIRVPGRAVRRPFFFAAVLATILGGSAVMYDVLGTNGLNALEAATLAVFVVTFGWITVAFWTAAAGFLLSLFNRDPLSLRRIVAGQPTLVAPPRTALVMPVHNEDALEVLARVEATWRSLEAAGSTESFEFFMLSDSAEECARTEAAGLAALAERLGTTGRMFHRRRADKVGRKAGNVAEFCRRWGGRYEYMVVLDADSVMSGETIRALVAAMLANPRAGLIQTAPMTVGQQTLFARFIQFSSRLYSPMLATGSSFWQMGHATYWGHNAIIRVAAFTHCCGLSPLPGKQPFGGEILSHDFVEAALLHRGGWSVFLLPSLEGSYEEVPPTILGYAARDRRWAQGNLQHLSLLGVRGLHWVGRLQFVFGALSYVSSLLWLLLLILGVTAALVQALFPHDYFKEGYSLFPVWPIDRTADLHALFAATVAMLLLPKVWGVIVCLASRQRRQAFGGGLWVVLSAAAEAVVATLIAPMMMAFHATFVATILMGRCVSWSAQHRSGSVTIAGALQVAGVPVVAGLAVAAVTWHLTPGFFWWLLPVTAGLVLAVPLIVWSSRESVGRAFARAGLFLIPEEISAPPALQALEEALANPVEMAGASRTLVTPPPESPMEMPALPWHRPPARPVKRLGRDPLRAE